MDAGKDIVQFIRGWQQIFLEHARRKWIIAAESCTIATLSRCVCRAVGLRLANPKSVSDGGHYIPAWTGAILDHNERAGPADRIPLAGIAIGNGIVNETVQAGSFTEFARRQKLIPDDATPESEGDARQLAEQTLGYAPNFYDYRLKSIDCCGCTSYNYSAWAHWFMREDVRKALNVCGSAGDAAFGGCAGGCVDLPNFDGHDTFDYSGALSRALQLGIRLTFCPQPTTRCFPSTFVPPTVGLSW